MKKKIAGDIIILHRCTKKHNHMRHSSWDTEWDNFFFFVILGHFLPFKNLKNIWRYYPFTHVHHKSKSYDVWFLRYKVQRTKFLSFQAIFCSLTLLRTQKIKILKNKKNIQRYYHFRVVYHKWRPYDVWFQRFQVRQTELFVILGYFLLFYAVNLILLI